MQKKKIFFPVFCLYKNVKCHGFVLQFAVWWFAASFFLRNHGANSDEPTRTKTNAVLHHRTTSLHANVPGGIAVLIGHT